VRELELKDGRKVNWRREVALRLMNLQKRDGSWENDNARWWEKETTLTTSYSLIALEMIWRGL
jgi:squalene-hopene/tetraprenyl-beta-curcumene cyclase